MQANLILPLQSSGKIDVTPQQSEILQKELFKMGYVWWASQEAKLKFTYEPYIFWDDYDKGISKENLHQLGIFTDNENPLHLFDNHFKIED